MLILLNTLHIFMKHFLHQFLCFKHTSKASASMKYKTTDPSIIPAVCPQHCPLTKTLCAFITYPLLLSVLSSRPLIADRKSGMEKDTCRLNIDAWNNIRRLHWFFFFFFFYYIIFGHVFLAFLPLEPFTADNITFPCKVHWWNLKGILKVQNRPGKVRS